MLSTRISLAAAIVLTLAIFSALLALYRPMYPLKPGDSRDIWMSVADINLDHEFRHRRNMSIAEHDGKWVYAFTGWDGPVVCEVPGTAMQDDLPRVEAYLGELSELDVRVRGYRAWKSLRRPLSDDPSVLLNWIEEVAVQQAGRDAPKLSDSHSLVHIATHDHYLADQIARTADFYPFNFACEFFYLSFLVWFALWPWIRNRSLLRILLHTAPLPLLFYLPLWLGYCIPTPITGAPAGGILYPWLLRGALAPLISPSWDLAFLSSLPPVLSVLHQGLPVNYASFRNYASHMEYHGPVDVLLRSILLTITVAVFYFLILLWRHRALARPGFPVIPLAQPPQDKSTPKSPVSL